MNIFYIRLEAVIRRCSVKKMFLEISQIWHLCQSLFLNKAAGLNPATLLKKRLWHRYFPVNFVKFLRIPFFNKISPVAAAVHSQIFYKMLIAKSNRCQTEQQKKVIFPKKVSITSLLVLCDRFLNKAILSKSFYSLRSGFRRELYHASKFFLLLVFFGAFEITAHVKHSPISFRKCFDYPERLVRITGPQKWKIFWGVRGGGGCWGCIKKSLSNIRQMTN